MKKIAAFFTALALFVVAAVGIHINIAGNLDTDCRGFGTWINPYKDLSYSAISKNLHDDSYLMMGSSEFQHGRKTPYHPTKVFRKADIDVMCVGAAYNQCLSHAITLGSVAPQLKTKKVTLILSPAWFYKGGVKKEAFSVRFSESEYMAMLNNKDLSDDLKKKIAQRTVELLEKDPNMKENVERYNKLLIDKRVNPVDRFYFSSRLAFINEKESVTVNSAWKLSGEKNYEKYKSKIDGKEPDWNTLLAESEKDFVKESGENPFYMKDRIYKRKFKSIVADQEGAMSERKFLKSSPEYDDLRLFLEVCKESGIECQLVLLPINGYWYDYTGFDKAERDKLPQQILEATKGYDYEWTSFYDEDYTEGFLEDAFHPAGKGWTEINEEVYKFFTEVKTENQ